MALSAQRPAGRAARGQDGRAPPRPLAWAHEPPAACPGPGPGRLSQASPGIYYPAALTLQPVYYAGRAC